MDKPFVLVIDHYPETLACVIAAHLHYLRIGCDQDIAESFNFAMGAAPHSFDVCWMLAGVTFDPELPGGLSEALRASKDIGAVHPLLPGRAVPPFAQGQLVSYAHLPMVALMIRREAWKQVGGYDLQLPIFAREADLGYRLRRQGWDLGLYQECLHTVSRQRPGDPSVTRRFNVAAERNLVAKYGENWADRLNV